MNCCFEFDSTDYLECCAEAAREIRENCLDDQYPDAMDDAVNALYAWNNFGEVYDSDKMYKDIYQRI